MWKYYPLITYPWIVLIEFLRSFFKRILEQKLKYFNSCVEKIKKWSPVEYKEIRANERLGASMVPKPTISYYITIL